MAVAIDIGKDRDRGLEGPSVLSTRILQFYRSVAAVPNVKYVVAVKIDDLVESIVIHVHNGGAPCAVICRYRHRPLETAVATVEYSEHGVSDFVSPWRNEYFRFAIIVDIGNRQHSIGAIVAGYRGGPKGAAIMIPCHDGSWLVVGRAHHFRVRVVVKIGDERKAVDRVIVEIRIGSRP